MNSLISIFFFISLIVIKANAFLVPMKTTHFTKSKMSLSMTGNKNINSNASFKIVPNVLLLMNLFISPAFADLQVAPWDNQIKYEVIKQSGSDVKPVTGDLVTIRFKGSYNGAVFDDTFSTAEPYFYRCGLGTVVKGLDESVLNMNIGDRYRLVFGGDLSFPNGRPAAPGRARILPKATIEYDVELIDVPGKGEDYILDS